MRVGVLPSRNVRDRMVTAGQGARRGQGLRVDCALKASGPGATTLHAGSRPAPDPRADVGERGDVRGTWRPETE